MILSEHLGLKWLEIDLNRLASNVQCLMKRVSPAGIIPVIKADAYGHGMIPVARTLKREGIESVAVATLEEALILRRHRIRMNTLLFGAYLPEQLIEILHHRFVPSICDVESGRLLNDAARRLGMTVDVHLVVDSGMGRMGYELDQADRIYDELQAMPHLRVAAVYSHFPVSESDDPKMVEYTRQQFRRLQEWANARNPRPDIHISNSGAVLNYPEANEYAVRPGLLLYGISPKDDRRIPEGISPILSMKCRPLFCKRMRAGSQVGYGRDYTLNRDAYIATLPVGYADGIPRALSSSLQVMINDRLFPVAGRVCMDMTMINLGDHCVTPDSEVTLMGGNGQSAHDWADAAGTIPYEIFTGLGRRWSRLYIGPGNSRQVVRSIR